MRTFRNILGTVLVLVGTLSSTALSQELYFRNKPYKGPVSGSWDGMMVGLHETAKIFELDVREEGGVFLIGSSQTSDVTPGQVVVDGKLLSSEPGANGPMVNLKELAQAAGLSYKPNREMAAIDVAKPATKLTGGQAYANDSGKPIYINKETPGDDLVLDTLAIKGKVTLVYLYHSRYPGAADYEALFNTVDPLAELPNTVLFKVCAGSQSSPLSKRYPGVVPRLYFFDRAGRYRTKGGGHGINLNSAKDTVQQLLKGQ